MPRKVRELIRDLKAAGFIDRGGKGSHRNYKHPSGTKMTLSGRSGEDAKGYQEKALKVALEEAENEK
jgi:predicted RNA binding protein YcfA (HicA-like mRNA interferase family)